MAQDKQREGPNGPSVSDIAAAFGAEGSLRRFFGTLFASVVTPNTVLRDAFENGSRFISPLRVFVILTGAVLALMTFLDARTNFALELALAPGGRDPAMDHVRAQGVDPTALEAAFDTWMRMSAWPVIIVSSAIFIVILKLYRPSITWWGHVCAYLVAMNALSVITLVAVVLSLTGLEVFAAVVGGLAMVIYLAAFVRIGAGVFKLGPFKLVALFLGVVIGNILVAAVMAGLQFALAIYIVSRFDLSLLQLIEISIEASSS